MKRYQYNLFVLCLLLVFTVSGLAQNTTGSISGIVKDSSNAVVSNATIHVTSTETGLARTVKTNESGEYIVSQIPIGTYTVAADKTGFKTEQSNNVQVQILSTVTVNFSLQVGEASQTVFVNAQGAQLDTQSSEAGTVIESRQINNLPLNVRQFMQLVFLAPMTVPATNDFRSFEIPRNTSVPAAAGQQPENNNYQIDGMDNRESGRNGFSISMPIDSVAEFRVQTGMPPAEFGRGGGAIVNVVTRGGTDKYHGSAYEFIRNNIFDAKPYFSNGTSPLKRNQFGASLGGPVLKQKLFLFGNYEGLRQAATGNPPVGLVPTVDQKNGIFTTAITDPSNNNQPFTNNTIPSNRINPISAKMLQLFPNPNVTGASGYNFIFNDVPSAHLSYNYAVGRVDYNMRPRDNMFVRYLYDQEVTNTPPTLPLPAFSGGKSIELRAQGLGAQWNHIYSPTLLNTFSLNYTRYHNQLATLNSYRQDFITTSGITNTLSAVSPLFWGVPNISIPGFLTPSDLTPSYRTMNEYQATDSVVWTRGKHTFKLGGDLQRIQTDMFYTGSNGFFSFANKYTGNNFADFLLGDADSVGKTTKSTNWNTWTNYMAAFLQDDWRPTSSLTMNFGIRYEVESAIKMSDSCGLDMSFANGVATQIVSTQCKSLAEIQNFSSAVRPDVLLQTTSHTAPYNADTNNFAPRFGFAYAMGDNTVLRGGYGVFYASPQVASTASSNNFAPNDLAPTWVSSPTTPTYSWNPEGQTSGVQTLKNAALTVFPFLSRSLPYGLVQEWNLNIQRKINNGLALEVMYQGSKDDHLMLFNNTDFRAPGPGNVQALLPYPQYARIQNFSTAGYSNYNGGSIRLEQSPWHGLNYLLAYTYSKSLDNGSTLNALPVWTDPFNQNGTAYGPSDFNATHRLSIAYTYFLPIGQGKALLGSLHGVGDKVLGGWGVRGITQLQSGLPQSPSMNLSREGICASACTARPDRVGNGNLSRGTRTIKHFYDVNAFQLLPAGGVSGRIGNAGRNILISPPINNFDFQLFKETTLRETQSVEFRWEMYNALNHTQWLAPGTNVESPSTFGVITGTQPPRIMQFALRYSF